MSAMQRRSKGGGRPERKMNLDHLALTEGSIKIIRPLNTTGRMTPEDIQKMSDKKFK